MKTWMVLLFLITAAHAGPRSSGSYNVPAESTDAGGTRASSVKYTNDGSLGGVGGTSAIASPAETAKHGFIGQLYEIVALQAAASPASVNEGATRQLSASLLLDDATFLQLAPATVSWIVEDGPLNSVSGAGLAAAGTVYQNTAAVVRGTYGGFTGKIELTVLDVLRDNYGSYAGDGLHDDWQVLYFGVNNSHASPLLDPDHDGWINLFEYNAGLVPNDQRSAFSFRAEPVPGQPGRRNIIFSPRLPGSSYTVLSSPDMAPGSWQPLTGAVTTDNGTERTVTDTGAAGARKFYRIEVQKP